MVQESEIIQVDVAFLSYAPELVAQKATVELDSISVAGLSELRRHEQLKRSQKQQMGHEAYKHFKWVSVKIAFRPWFVLRNLFLCFCDLVLENAQGWAEAGGTKEDAENRSLGYQLE